MENMTPMLSQYSKLKRIHTDSILLYQLGDFYEMFFEDAVIGSKVLGITLTSRTKGYKKKIPMAGFPCRAFITYVSKLVENGNKVVVCDQVKDEFRNKGIVERKVTRIITPGMVIDESFLGKKINNFILSVFKVNEFFGLSYLDLSTGDFFATESSDILNIIEEIMRVLPSEILISKKLEKDLKKFIPSNSFFNIFISNIKECDLVRSDLEKILFKQFKINDIKNLGFDCMSASACASGLLVKYINDTQKTEFNHLKMLKIYSLSGFLAVNSRSSANLELFNEIESKSTVNTLFGILDKTITPMGKRMLSNWLRYPLLNISSIIERYEGVSESLKNREVRADIRGILKSVSDLERIMSRISMGTANPRDLLALKKTIKIVPSLLRKTKKFDSKIFSFSKKLDKLYSISELIENSIREDAPSNIGDGCVIRRGFNSEFDKLFKISMDSKKWIVDLENGEKKRTGISLLKIRYNKILGYYFEVSKANSKLLPDYYECKQTLVNSSRYTISLLKDYESQIFSADSKRVALEISLFKEILYKINELNFKIQLMADFISIVDCITNFGFIADLNDYCRPELNLTGEINIEDGRHPVVEQLVHGERFVPNSVKMDMFDTQIIILTGPNMAGKSTILRQVSLAIIMAHIGSFVPAKSANISITDKIFTRVGALDNLAAGESTFMSEMSEISYIVNNCTENSFIIIDEIGRGTSVPDGVSIAWSISEYLHDFKKIGIKTMIATHYHEMNELEKIKQRIKNFSIKSKEIGNNIIFMRRMSQGSTNKSHGIYVAKLAGIPESIIERAKWILDKINLSDLSNSFVNSMIDTNSIFNEFKKDIYENKKKGNVGIERISEERTIILKLLKINILSMNPIDALNFLNKLHLKAKKLEIEK